MKNFVGHYIAYKPLSTCWTDCNFAKGTICPLTSGVLLVCCEWDVTRRRLSIQIECVTGSDIVELKSSINICNVLRDVCVCPGSDTNDEVKEVTEKMKKMTSSRCYGYNNNCTLNRFQRNQLLEMWNSFKQTFCHISKSSVTIRPRMEQKGKRQRKWEKSNTDFSQFDNDHF